MPPEKSRVAEENPELVDEFKEALRLTALAQDQELVVLVKMRRTGFTWREIGDILGGETPQNAEMMYTRRLAKAAEHLLLEKS